MKPIQTGSFGLAAALVGALMSLGCSTDPAQATNWGSDQVSLQMTGSGARVEFLASGGCYGSFGVVDHPIPAGTFTLSGTFTQLMGASPGSVQYPAEYSGTRAGSKLTINVSISGQPLTLGPFQLTAGVTQSWPACLYP